MTTTVHVRDSIFHTHTHTHGRHHSDEDGEGGNDLGQEPVGGLDVLVLLQHRVVDIELLTRLLCLALANVALDLLLKLWTSSLLRPPGKKKTVIHVHHSNVITHMTYTDLFE